MISSEAPLLFAKAAQIFITEVRGSPRILYVFFMYSWLCFWFMILRDTTATMYVFESNAKKVDLYQFLNIWYNRQREGFGSENTFSAYAVSFWKIIIIYLNELCLLLADIARMDSHRRFKAPHVATERHRHGHHQVRSGICYFLLILPFCNFFYFLLSLLIFW